MNPNRVHIKRTQGGFDGAGELALGRSRVRFEGHLDQQEINRLAKMALLAQRWIQENGRPIDTSGTDFLDAFSKGVDVVGNVAESLVGDVVATVGGPYGMMAVAAARGAPDAVAAIKGALGPAGPTAAALSHPDPAVREKAKPVVDAIVSGAKMGDLRAQAARMDLTAAMIRHKDMLLAERSQTINVLKDRLALLGDPLSYADTGGEDVNAYGFGDEGAPIVSNQAPCSYFEADTGATVAAPPPSLTAALDRAIGRARHDPQPTFRRPARR